ncbi:hypothetical protein [uncultured Helicobacter sp.]|nr:hypothetical protein [uncultured Helicobacter sp.]
MQIYSKYKDSQVNLAVQLAGGGQMYIYDYQYRQAYTQAPCQIA